MRFLMHHETAWFLFFGLMGFSVLYGTCRGVGHMLTGRYRLPRKQRRARAAGALGTSVASPIGALTMTPIRRPGPLRAVLALAYAGVGGMAGASLVTLLALPVRGPSQALPLLLVPVALFFGIRDTARAARSLVRAAEDAPAVIAPTPRRPTENRRGLSVVSSRDAAKAGAARGSSA